jgi:hypothetical protein
LSDAAPHRQHAAPIASLQLLRKEPD